MQLLSLAKHKTNVHQAAYEIIDFVTKPEVNGKADIANAPITPQIIVIGIL